MKPIFLFLFASPKRNKKETGINYSVIPAGALTGLCSMVIKGSRSLI